MIEGGFARLAAVDASALPEGCVGDTVRRLGRLDGRLEGFQARFVAAAEAAGLPERSGASSTTSWVSQQTGRSGGQAARTGRLARAAGTAPELADAVANGEVGPDQANTIAAGLDRGELGPEDVGELLPAARRETPDRFRRHARQHAGRRRQERLRDQELIARDQRHHRQWRTQDGSLRYEGLLPPAEGDRMEKAISAFYQPDGRDVPDGQRRTHEQRAADAMSALLDGALRAGAAGDVGGVRPAINVAVPYEAMAPLADAESAGLTAVSDCGTVLSMAAFKKLACDAVIRRTVIGPDSQPLDVGRATRKWPAPMRAAIAVADGGCRGPGCDLPPDRCIVHHITWWEQGGDTAADNGVMVCGYHHDLVHDQGWTLQMVPATRHCTWTAPDGTALRTRPRGRGARDAAAPRPMTTAVPGQRDDRPAGHDRRSGPRPDGRDDNHHPPTTTRRSPGPARPLGRGEPGRPRGPGADPPRTDPPRTDPPGADRSHLGDRSDLRELDERNEPDERPARGERDDRASPAVRFDDPEPLRLEF